MYLLLSLLNLTFVRSLQNRLVLSQLESLRFPEGGGLRNLAREVPSLRSWRKFIYDLGERLTSLAWNVRIIVQWRQNLLHRRVGSLIVSKANLLDALEARSAPPSGCGVFFGLHINCAEQG